MMLMMLVMLIMSMTLMMLDADAVDEVMLCMKRCCAGVCVLVLVLMRMHVQ